MNFVCMLMMGFGHMFEHQCGSCSGHFLPQTIRIDIHNCLGWILATYVHFQALARDPVTSS
jgi:hypothetical protein